MLRRSHHSSRVAVALSVLAACGEPDKPGPRCDGAGVGAQRCEGGE